MVITLKCIGSQRNSKRSVERLCRVCLSCVYTFYVQVSIAIAF